MTDLAIRSNYHTHCNYCDGQGEITEYLEAAVAAGLQSYGVSSHAPLPFETGWTMKPEDLDAYVAEARAAQTAFRDRLPVFVGLELDYYPGLEQFHREQVLRHHFDYLVGSVHFVGHEGPGQPWGVDSREADVRTGIARSFGGDGRKFVEEYFALQRAMLAAEPISFVGHLDRAKIFNFNQQFFDECAPWYRQAVLETLRAIKIADLPIELNTKGYGHQIQQPYPSEWICALARDLGVPIVVNSDGHRPDQVVSYYDEAAALLRRVGYREILRFDGQRWSPTPLAGAD